MKKAFFGLLILLVSSSAISAANGDTAYVKVFDKYHMGYNGNHDKKALAPAATFKSQRIWMKYTIGCTSTGQCEWDYTIKLMVRQHTGKNDSTLKQAPSFKVLGGTAKDTLVNYSSDTTYISMFNAVKKSTDSTLATRIKIAMFRDTLHPLVCTDTLAVWPANYYRYHYDTLGVKIDSFMVVSNQQMKVKYTPYYSVFEVVNDYEMGRMISPYAKSFPKTFAYEHLYDVTDFASLLHDSVELRINYGGYTWGFTSTVELYFVEGTPARDPYALETVYNGYYNYGQATSIETALSQKTIHMPSDAASAKLRLLVTGHGGEANENCAEFCAKNYFLKMNGTVIASQLVWKDDCGSNAIINQPGTWIYDRSNWCPGEKIRLYEYPLNLTAGTTSNLDLDFDGFSANGGAGYNISAYVVYYKAYTRTVDAGIDDILAPSKNFWYSRFNPVCDNATVVLRNFGSAPITSAEFTYTMGNASSTVYQWQGTLAPEQQIEVRLPYMKWPSDLTQNTFKVQLTKVNGSATADENPNNNVMTSQTDIPTAVPNVIIVETTTNLSPSDNSYTITDAYKNVVYTRSFTKASSIHRDTIALGLGCYTLELNDAGKNGLSFWANNDGSGSFRIRSGIPPVTNIKTFNADFGNFIRFNFTVTYKVGLDEEVRKALAETRIYPSPATDDIMLESDAAIEKVIIMDMQGRFLKEHSMIQGDKIHVAELPSGIYLVRLTDNQNHSVTKKISIAR